MVFGRNFCEKRQIWVSEPHFREVRRDARTWLRAGCFNDISCLVWENHTTLLDRSWTLWRKEERKTQPCRLICYNFYWIHELVKKNLTLAPPGALLSTGARRPCFRLLPVLTPPDTNTYNSWVCNRNRPRPKCVRNASLLYFVRINVSFSLFVQCASGICVCRTAHEQYITWGTCWEQRRMI